MAKRVMIIIDGMISDGMWRETQDGARECGMSTWEYFAVTLKEYLKASLSNDFKGTTVRIREITERDGSEHRPRELRALSR